MTTQTKAQIQGQPAQTTDHFELYTDGSCAPNPGEGGWGFTLLQNNSSILEDYGYQANSTNNRMEMMAIVEGLRQYREFQETQHEDPKDFSPLKVFSDSLYVIDGMNHWIEGWKQKDWANKIKNKDLWKEIDNLSKALPKVEWIHVRGHRGNVGNERADDLASMGRKLGSRAPGAAVMTEAATTPAQADIVAPIPKAPSAKTLMAEVQVQAGEQKVKAPVGYLEYCVLTILARRLTQSIDSSNASLDVFDINHEITSWMRPPTSWTVKCLQGLKDSSLVSQISPTQWSITIEGLKVLVEGMG